MNYSYIPVQIINGKIELNGIINEINKDKKHNKVLDIKESNFNELNLSNQIEILGELVNLVKEYNLLGIKVSINLININKKYLRLLKKNSVKVIEVLIESSDEYILRNIGQQYTFYDAKKIVRQIKFLGCILNTKVVIGLPESSLADDLNTVKKCLKLKPKAIKLEICQEDYSQNVNKLYKENEFEPLSKIQIAERIKESIYLIKKAKIKNIMIDTKKKEIEDLTIEKFRNLIQSDIWYEKITDTIKSYNVKVKEVEIEVESKEIENVKGFENRNLTKLKELYDVELKIIPNSKMINGKFKLNIIKTYADFLD